MRPTRGRVMMIALDGAEASLLETWLADGTLPHLKRLRDRGGWGVIESTTDLLVGTAWSSFYTGQWPSEHGLVLYRQWRPERMEYDRPRPDWLPIEPFYRQFGPNGPRVVAVDMPAAPPPTPFHGVELTNWAAHAAITRRMAAYPASLKRWVKRQYGSPPITDEIYGPQRIEALLQLRDRMIESTTLQADLCLGLMDRERWDLFMVGFGGIHRAGHKLWDRTSIHGSVPDSLGREFDCALKRVYEATDRAVGRILEALKHEEDVTVLVCSLNGMGPNTSRAHLLPEMLERVLKGEQAESISPAGQHGSLQWARQLIPVEWRSAIKRRLPIRIRDAMWRFWQRSDVAKWSETKAFCLVSDLQGLIEINLKSREREGIVEPGDAYEALVRLITQGLMSFLDAESGQPIISRIDRGDRIWPDSARRINMPDLIVQWSATPSARERAVRSPRHGTVRNPSLGLQADGRSGHHRSDGWLLAVGEGIEPGTTMGRIREFDLNASIHELLGVERHALMRGRVIAALLSWSARP